MDQESFYDLIESDHLEAALYTLEELPNDVKTAKINHIFNSDNPNIKMFSLWDWILCNETGEMCSNSGCGGGGTVCCCLTICIIFALTQGNCCFTCGDCFCGESCCSNICYPN